MVELILCLLIISLCAVLFSNVSDILLSLQKQDYHIEDELAVTQLRYMFIQSTDVEYSDEALRFQYRGEKWELYPSSSYLVKSPGYEIFMLDIKSGYFSYDQSCIYWNWEREEYEEQSALLYCE